MARKTLQHQDLYTVLGVQPTANIADIRSKYRQAALRSHPDKGGSPEAFHLLTTAFEILSCPTARLNYDTGRKYSSVGHTEAEISHKTCYMSTPTPPCRGRQCISTARHHSPVMGLKRPAETNQYRNVPEPPTKRWCGTCSPKDGTKRLACTPRLTSSLNQLKIVLQEMPPKQRRTTLQALSPRLQASLVLFMKAVEVSPGALQINDSVYEKLKIDGKGKEQLAPCSARPQSVSWISSHANLRNCGSIYKAHVHIKALRFYTHGHPEIEVAVERQMILVQLKQALASAGEQSPNFWDDADEVYSRCMEVLSANSALQVGIDLSSYVYLRAGHYLPQNCTIISPVMPLKETLKWHCRLLHARQTSWQNLRTEWILLMQSARQPLAKRKSLAEAEAIADEARASALEIQFMRAVAIATSALDFEDKQVAKQKRMINRQLAQERTQMAKERKAADALNRRFMKQREKQYNERRKWWKRSDLTMEDILRGPPCNEVNGLAGRAGDSRVICRAPIMSGFE